MWEVTSSPDCQYPVVRQVAKKGLGWRLQLGREDAGWDVYWTDNAVEADFLGKMQPHQKVNHFPGMSAISRKNNLAKNLLAMKDRFHQQYNFYPKTWLLPVDYNALRAEYEGREKGKAKTFIVKPEASCQGRGIFLTRNVLADIQMNAHYVVQRYLHRPMLLEGLKFDLRIYVLLAGCDPLRVYVYREGLTRLATVEYNPPRRENLDNLCMHLTNYAINKDNPNFVFNTSEQDLTRGHKRSLTSTMEWLEAQGRDLPRLQHEIDMIILRTLVAGQPQLSHNYRSGQFQNLANNMCFQLLGFDVILDHNCKPYLLEVNHTPSFTTDTPLDRLVKEGLIRDALVLMNINEKARSAIQKARSKEVQERVYSGKRRKLTPQERAALALQQQLRRDEYQNAHLGGFRKIYPDKAIDLSEELEYANAFYETKSQVRGKVRNLSQTRATLAKPPKPPTQSGTSFASKAEMPLTNKRLLSGRSPRRGLKSETRVRDSRESLARSECSREDKARVQSEEVLEAQK